VHLVSVYLTGCASHRCILIGVYLTGVHLIGVCLGAFQIFEFRRFRAKHKVDTNYPSGPPQSTLASINNLAAVLRDQGKYEQAGRDVSTRAQAV
jgi:hypothetical protein